MSQRGYSDARFGVHGFTNDPDGLFERSPNCMEPGDERWRPAIPGDDQLLLNFKNRMDDDATTHFYRNLKGKKDYWEETKDYVDPGGLDSVDLFFASTHGVASPHLPGLLQGCPDPPGDNNVRAKWAMWNDATWAFSHNMVLGNDSRGLSIFTTYACQTAAWDGYTWDRHYSMFFGGLRVVLGMAKVFYTCWDAQPTPCTDQPYHGKKFADYLIAGVPIVFAWGAAMDGPNDGWTFSPSGINTGNSPSDCYSRTDNMTWQNFRSYPRRTGSQITSMCGWSWEGLD